MRMSRRKFEALVERALGTIPAEIRGRMDNVEIVVEDWPDEGHYATVGLEPTETLFGLYEGVPLIERGIVADPLLPDKITIFQGPLEEACDTDGGIAVIRRRSRRWRTRLGGSCGGAWRASTSVWCTTCLPWQRTWR